MLQASVQFNTQSMQYHFHYYFSEFELTSHSFHSELR